MKLQVINHLTQLYQKAKVLRMLHLGITSLETVKLDNF